MSIAWVATWGHADVSDPGCLWGLCLGSWSYYKRGKSSWSLLSPEAMRKLMIWAPAACKEQLNYLKHGRILWQPVFPLRPLAKVMAWKGSHQKTLKNCEPNAGCCVASTIDGSGWSAGGKDSVCAFFEGWATGSLIMLQKLYRHTNCTCFCLFVWGWGNYRSRDQTWKGWEGSGIGCMMWSFQRISKNIFSKKNYIK